MRTYTVGELIKVLQDLPKDLPILDECYEGIYCTAVVHDTCPWLPNDYVSFKTTTYDMD